VVRAVDAVAGRHVTAAATPARIVVQVPDPVGPLPVAAMRCGLDALVDLGDPSTPAEDLGASARWFVELARLADAVLDARRVRPLLVHDGPVWMARWQVVGDAAVDQRLAELQAARPAVCGDADDLFPKIVDGFARRRLTEGGWRPPSPVRARGSDYRAAQAMFRALGSASGAVLYRTEDVPALVDLARTAAHELDRATGLPVVVPQVRLALPTTADGEWQVSIEVFDADRPDRWCTLADLHDGAEPALEIVGTDAAFAARVRQQAAEVAAQLAERVPLLDPLGVRPASVITLDLDEVDGFLATAPAALHDLGVSLVGPEQLVRARPGVKGSASPRPAGAGGGRFDARALMEWQATVDDTPIDDATLERAAEAGASLVHVNGRWVRLDAAQAKVALERLHRNRHEHAELDVVTLLRLTAEAAIAGSTAPVAAQRPSGVAARVQRTNEPVVTVSGEGWLDDLLAGLPDDRLREEHEPAGFVGELRHYQRRGLGWMGFLGRLGLGGCLADDMGLGKTATTLAHLVTRPGPHLVVCPLSVVHNWSAESARFTPGLRVSIHHGGDRGKAIESISGTDIVITTYGLLARDIDALSTIRWDTLVLDEAQAVKNHLTKAAKAVRRLTTTQRVALTGTPVENHLGELWSILDAVNPGMFGSAKSFADRYANPIQKGGDQAATAALRALTQPFVLRRTKADRTLLPELPDKIEQVAWATLTREQATMYQSVVDRLLADAQSTDGMRRRGLVLAALTRLKQICNHPAHASGDGSRLPGRSGKLSRFDELVDDLLEVDERALVFTQFREMGLLLQRHLGERFGERFGETVPFLHGGVARTARDRMVARFQADEGPPLLLVSLKAGGTGLNLTSASQVIHYDRWWNPAVEDQATDRAWRIGQSHTVLVHKLVCEGTLEERIAQLIDDKKQLASSVLGTGETWLSEMSTDELRDLVRLELLADGGVR
jgi:non-specific serine/threonine protein kinase